MVQQRGTDPVVTRREFSALARSVTLLWKRARRHTMWLLSYRSTAVIAVIAALVSLLGAYLSWAARHGGG